MSDEPHQEHQLPVVGEVAHHGRGDAKPAPPRCGHGLLAPVFRVERFEGEDELAGLCNIQREANAEALGCDQHSRPFRDLGALERVLKAPREHLGV